MKTNIITAALIFAFGTFAFSQENKVNVEATPKVKIVEQLVGVVATPAQTQKVLTLVNGSKQGSLVHVKGIGPKTEEKIFQYVKVNGPIVDVTDLQKVNGVGIVTMQRLLEACKPVSVADASLDGLD